MSLTRNVTRQIIKGIFCKNKKKENVMKTFYEKPYVCIADIIFVAMLKDSSRLRMTVTWILCYGQ